jgi:hypothetical protein
MMNVVPSELRRVEPVSDELVLAAFERAERHREREEEGIWLPHVVRHLGFIEGSWTTRRLRPQLEALRTAGALSCWRRRGLIVWGLTAAGRQRLAHARRAGKLAELPESPQHREWRAARAAAGERVDGFRAELRAILTEASALLEDEATPTNVWFELRERLARISWRLGSAVYCMREWSEPDEAKADVDDGDDHADERLDRNTRWHLRVLRTGRRNTGRWDERDPWEAPPASD